MAGGDGARGCACARGRTCGPVPQPFVVPVGLKHPSPAVGPAVPLGKVGAGAGASHHEVRSVPAAMRQRRKRKPGAPGSGSGRPWQQEGAHPVPASPSSATGRSFPVSSPSFLRRGSLRSEGGCPERAPGTDQPRGDSGRLTSTPSSVPVPRGAVHMWPCSRRQCARPRRFTGTWEGCEPPSLGGTARAHPGARPQGACLSARWPRWLCLRLLPQ